MPGSSQASGALPRDPAALPATSQAEHSGEQTQVVIDAAYLAHQREWSAATFGPGGRPKGVIDHIRSELGEVEDDPTDLGEWVDIIILAFDGAWRAGHEPQAILDAVAAKQARNEGRVWPDWRTQDPDKAIEHTPETWLVAVAKVLRDAPPEGVSAVDIGRQMNERWPGAFPYVTALDIADQLPHIGVKRTADIGSSEGRS